MRTQSVLKPVVFLSLAATVLAACGSSEPAPAAEPAAEQPEAWRRADNQLRYRFGEQARITDFVDRTEPGNPRACGYVQAPGQRRQAWTMHKGIVITQQEAGAAWRESEQAVCGETWTPAPALAPAQEGAAPAPAKS